jgi:hypothetical protein
MRKINKLVEGLWNERQFNFLTQILINLLNPDQLKK